MNTDGEAGMRPSIGRDRAPLAFAEPSFQIYLRQIYPHQIDPRAGLHGTGPLGAPAARIASIRTGRRFPIVHF
jgi:hypothetical protein